MTHRLVIHLTDDWPENPSADWALLDANDTLVQQGRSAPLHWPAAAQHHVLLGGSQCVWLEVQLPPARKRDRERLLNYALEDRLVADAERQHLTITHTRNDTGQALTGVLAISRARVSRLLEQFALLERPLLSLRSMLQSVPAFDGDVAILHQHGTYAVLRGDTPCCQAVDLGDDAADTALALLLRHAAGAEAGLPPKRLKIWQGDGVPPLKLDPALLTRFDLQRESAPPWWKGHRLATELLHGEHAPARQGHASWNTLRGPAILAACAAFALTTVNVIDIVRLQHAGDSLETRMLRLFEEHLPGTPAIAPAAQMRRALTTLRRAHGDLTEDDLLALLHAHVNADGPPPQTLEYEDGRLRLRFSPTQAEAASATTGRIRLQGMEATYSDLEMTIRPAPIQP